MDEATATAPPAVPSTSCGAIGRRSAAGATDPARNSGGPGPSPVKPGDISRTRRAGLGALSLLAQRGTALAVSLMVTPAVVAALSGQQYGQWLMLLQFMGYVSLVDLGNSTVLKLDLATQQHLDNAEEKRRQIGAAMMGLALTTPLYLLAGGLLIWAAAAIAIPSAPAALLPAAGLVLLSLLVGRFSSTLTHVLFGLNLDYKSTGARTAIAVLAALLDLVIVKLGGGLIGLAANKFLSAILLWGILHWTVRRHVPWYGCQRPPREEFWRLFRRNVRYMTAQWGSVFSEATDVVLIGFLLGPAVAAAYSLTGALARMFSATASAMLGSVRSGQGDLFGRGRFDALVTLRLQMHTTTILVFSIVGSVILLINRSFIELWVGPEQFAGWQVTLGVTMLWLMLTLNRQEIGLLMACLQLNNTAWIHLSSAGISFAAGALLGMRFGLGAAVAGLVLGQGIAFVRYLHLSAKTLQQSIWVHAADLLRPAVTLAVLFGGAIWAGHTVRAGNWISLTGIAALVALGAAGLVWATALTPALRETLRQRFSSIATTLSLRPGN